MFKGLAWHLTPMRQTLKQARAETMFKILNIVTIVALSGCAIIKVPVKIATTTVSVAAKAVETAVSAVSTTASIAETAVSATSTALSVNAKKTDLALGISKQSINLLTKDTPAKDIAADAPPTN